MRLEAEILELGKEKKTSKEEVITHISIDDKNLWDKEGFSILSFRMGNEGLIDYVMSNQDLYRLAHFIIETTNEDTIKNT